MATAFVLDHASFLGIKELRKIIPSIDFPTGYEHSIGNTDIAILGINVILPSHWTIQQISDYVHKNGGFIVYLHPMKGSPLHWKELNTWMAQKFVDAWECYNARCRHNDHCQKLPLLPIVGADLHDVAELDHFNTQLLTKYPFPATFPLQEKLLERENIAKDFSFEWGCVSFNKGVDGLTIFIVLTNELRYAQEPDVLSDGDCFEIALFKGEKQGWLLLCSLSDNGHRTFYEITQDGVVKTKNIEYPMLQVTIRSRNIVVTIPQKYHHTGIAFSINRQELLPGSQRLSWPAPVWPPRSIRDTFIYE